MSRCRPGVGSCFPPHLCVGVASFCGSCFPPHLCVGVAGFRPFLDLVECPFFCSSLRPVYALFCLPTFVQLLHVTVLFGNSLCTIRRLIRSSQLSSTCSIMPLATKNFALIATLLAVAVSHVQPSTVICCPLQVDRVDLVGLIIRFTSRASFADNKLAVHPVGYCCDSERLYALFLAM